MFFLKAGLKFNIFHVIKLVDTKQKEFKMMTQCFYVLIYKSGCLTFFN